MATLIAFYVAGAGILGMMALKFHEVKTGKPTLLSRIGEYTDHIVHDAYDWVRKMLAYFNRKNGILLIQWIAVHVLSWTRKAYHFFYELAHRHPRVREVTDMVRGKGYASIKESGASFFLKRIKEETKMPAPSAPQAQGGSEAKEMATSTQNGNSMLK